MKSQVVLLKCLLLDAGDAFGFDPSRDIITVENRVRHEGEAFMSIALPRLDDLLLAGLRDGLLPSFEGWKSRCAFPEFLRDLWNRVFSADGVLLDSPDVRAIAWLRQISRFHKKIFEVCEPDRVDEAVARFVQIDSELPARRDIKSSMDPYLPMVSQILFGNIIGSAISAPLEGRHGPGAVSERLGSNSRWNFHSVSYSAQSLVGPEYFRPSWESLQNRPPETETVPARLVAVPKTAEKPRLISIEPSYNQYVQQALMVNLKRSLERASSVCSFVDQQINRSMAFEASKSGVYATLDLSDASDRVSLGLVSEVFSFNETFLRYLRLSRSAFVQLPGDEIVLLNKFASMGSALTFPVEAMVFTALVVTSICREQNDFSPQNIRSWGKRGRGLSIYGDDIIIPVEFTESAITALESVGLKVNTAKSFSSGKFRESCGLDGYDGQDVTPVYLRRRFPSDRSETTELISLISFRNQMALKYGEFSHTSRYLTDYLVGRCGVPYAPFGASGHSVWTSESHLWRTRWNANLQRLEAGVLLSTDFRREDIATDDGLLFKGLSSVKGGIRPPRGDIREYALSLSSSASSVDEDSLRLDGRPVASKLHYRWVSIS